MFTKHKKYFMDILLNVLKSFYEGFVKFLPLVLMASFVLIIGIIVGKIVGKIVQIIFEKLIGIEEILESKKLEKALYGIPLSKLLSDLVKWAIYLVSLAYALRILPLEGLKIFSEILLQYLPNIYSAIFVLIFGFLIGELIKNVVLSADIKLKNEIASFSKFLIVYVALIFSLQILGINPDILIRVLEIFLIAFAASAGIILGVLIVYTFKEDIKRLLEEFRRA